MKFRALLALLVLGMAASSLPALSARALQLESSGDVTCDELTNSIDAALILQLRAGFTSSLPCPQNADVNEDGAISSIDAALILQYDAGLLSSLSPEETTRPTSALPPGSLPDNTPSSPRQTVPPTITVTSPPTLAPTATMTPTPTSGPTATTTPTPTPAPPSPTPTPTSGPTATATPTPTPAPPSPTPTPTFALSPTATPTFAPSPTAAPTPTSPVDFPIRAAFFYPWFPSAWQQSGFDPFTNYTPSLGYYDSRDDAVISEQLDLAATSGLDAFISSWWGQGHYTDTAFQYILDRSARSGSPNPSLRWAIYYELESQGDPTAEEIASDLEYLAANVFSQTGYLRVDAAPVVFVYAGPDDGADMAARWAEAKDRFGGGLYVVLKVYPGYRNDPNQPDSWHQYAPARAYDAQLPYSVTVSPGFWLKGEGPRLSRDSGRFEEDVSRMVASGAPWQLITSWNEWGEGTSVEPATEFANAYINILCRHLPGTQDCQTASPTPPTSGADPVIAAAGDISCGHESAAGTCRQMDTSDLLLQVDPDVVLALGDLQYELGQYENFVDFYNPSWGRVKDKTFPAVGNHEYGTSGTSWPECQGEAHAYACGYFDYFNGDGNFTGRAGDRDKGYYAFDLGSWRLYAINSNCTRTGAPSCEMDSTQEEWLRLDLAAHSRSCQLMYLHHPLWTSDTRDFDTSELLPIFRTFYEAGGDVLLVGHSHFYERFAPQDPSGNVDTAQGVRQFVVGTGGRNVYGFGDIEANSEVRNGDTFGVIKLTLHPDSYDWEFVPIEGETFADAGTDPCHGPLPDTDPPTAPSNLGATAVAGNRVDLTWDASTDNVRVAGYKILRNGIQIATSATTSYSDTTVQPTTSYDYHVVAYDLSGSDSSPSETRSVTTTGTLVYTLSPVDDAYVDSTDPDATHGSDSTLQVDGSPAQDMLLKFSVSGTGAGQVESVKLRLYNRNPSGNGGDFYSVADTSWAESTVTWNNAPVADATRVASLGSVVVGDWYEVDVASALAGDGLVAFRGTSSATDGAWYSSKEGPEAPQLVVTVSSGPAGIGQASLPPGSLHVSRERSERMGDWLHHSAGWQCELPPAGNCLSIASSPILRAKRYLVYLRLRQANASTPPTSRASAARMNQNPFR